MSIYPLTVLFKKKNYILGTLAGIHAIWHSVLFLVCCSLKKNGVGAIWGCEGLCKGFIYHLCDACTTKACSEPYDPQG